MNKKTIITVLVVVVALGILIPLALWLRMLCGMYFTNHII